MPGKRRVVWHVRGFALALIVLRASGALAAWVVNEPPTLAVVGGAIGLVESVVWLGTGLTDTATGGYFETGPDAP